MSSSDLRGALLAANEQLEEGRGVNSAVQEKIDEVIAAMGNAIDQMRESQGLMHAMLDSINQGRGLAWENLEGTSNYAVVDALGGLNLVIENVEDDIQKLNKFIDDLEQRQRALEAAKTTMEENDGKINHAISEIAAHANNRV